MWRRDSISREGLGSFLLSNAIMLGLLMLDVRCTPSGMRDVSMAQQKRHVSMETWRRQSRISNARMAINAAAQLSLSMSTDTKKALAVADPMLCTRSPTSVWLLGPLVKSLAKSRTARSRDADMMP